MTSSSPAMRAWAARPVGKAVRVALAVGGMTTATLVLMTAATVVSSRSWALVILGVGLAALSVRAARVPNATRLLLVAVVLVGIGMTIQSL